jgi:hypothetical protein
MGDLAYANFGDADDLEVCAAKWVELVGCVGF